MKLLRPGVRLKIAKPLLPYLPVSVLNKLIRRRPYLTGSLPVGFQLKWPYYLGDITALVDVNNAIENQMISGEYDWEVSHTIRHYVRPGNFCVDVGANSGPVTLLLAKLVGCEGRVLSFEPGPPYCERLKQNLDSNPGFNEIVTLIPEGLSDHEGTLLWAADSQHPYNGVLNVVDGTRVRVSTLDVSLRRYGWSRLDFVKIDVEGMEVEVFRGARETLEKFRPVVLFETIEGFKELRGFDIFSEIEGLLKSLDYGLYYLTPSDVLIEVHANNLPLNTVALPLERNNR